MAWLRIAGFAILATVGSFLVAETVWGSLLAYILGSLFGLVHLANLNLPVAAEMIGEFCVGLLMLSFGVRGLWRSVVGWSRERKAQTQAA